MRRKSTGSCSSSDSEYNASSSHDDEEEEEEEEGDGSTGSDGDDSVDDSTDDTDAVGDGERDELEKEEQEDDMDCDVSREKLKGKKEKAIVASTPLRPPVIAGVPSPIARRKRSSYRNASKPMPHPSKNKSVYILLDSDDDEHAGTPLEESSSGTDPCNSFFGSKAVSMEEEKVQCFPSESGEKPVSKGEEVSLEKNKDSEPHGHMVEPENRSREAEDIPLRLEKEKALPLDELVTDSSGGTKAATLDKGNLHMEKEKALPLDEL